MSHEVKILETEMLNHNVKRFVTTKPASYEYVAGQATAVTLLRDGLESEPRPFTFTSLPEDRHLEFMIKLYYDRDGVTDELSSVGEGERFEIGEPDGAITYAGPGTFIAGGAGLTPFIPILRDLRAKDELAGNQLWFFNSHPRDIFLESELRETFGKGDDLRLLVTDHEGDTSYEEAELDEAFCQNNLETDDGRFYICGPPEMTESAIELLQDMGIDDERIIAENWS
ncbi:flavodoxin reductase [bacterium]|nr:flavodoxin reductase [bacterium]